MKRTVDLLRGLLIAGAITALLTTAGAQSASTDYIENGWGFHVDSNSAGTNLGISFNGSEVYNLQNAATSQFISSYGSGAASTANQAYYYGYMYPNYQGYNIVQGNASTGSAVGGAVATVGSESFVRLVNDDTSAITLDLSSFVDFKSTLTAGPNGYSTLNSYVGIDAYDVSGPAPVLVLSPSANFYGNSNAGLSVGGSGDYTYYGVIQGFSVYYVEPTLLLNPGDTYDFVFYASTINTALTTPTPSNAAVMMFGLAGFGLLRRRQTVNRQP